MSDGSLANADKNNDLTSLNCSQTCYYTVLLNHVCQSYLAYCITDRPGSIKCAAKKCKCRESWKVPNFKSESRFLEATKSVIRRIEVVVKDGPVHRRKVKVPFEIGAVSRRRKKGNNIPSSQKESITMYTNIFRVSTLIIYIIKYK